MDGWLIGLIIAVAGQFGLLWYKIGRLEQKVEDLGRRVAAANNTEARRS